MTLGVNMMEVKPGILPTKKAVFFAHSNEKGGVGKTAIGFNQAYRLAEQGKRVLVVDFDGQRNMSKLLLGSVAAVAEVESSGFVSSKLFYPNLEVADISVYQSVVHQNIAVIPASKDGIAGVMAAGKEAVAMIANPKKYLRNLDFDFVLIDTPPSLGVTQAAAINCIDYMFVPVTVDDFSNEGLMSLVKTMKLIKVKLQSSVQLGGVYINFFEKPAARQGENPYQDILDKIRKDYASVMLDGYIPRSVSIHEARMSGRAAWVSPPNGNAAAVGRTLRTIIDLMNSKMIKGVK
jgi:chromosome partitioning protein